MGIVVVFLLETREEEKEEELVSTVQSSIKMKMKRN